MKVILDFLIHFVLGKKRELRPKQGDEACPRNIQKSVAEMVPDPMGLPTRRSMLCQLSHHTQLQASGEKTPEETNRSCLQETMRSWSLLSKSMCRPNILMASVIPELAFQFIVVMGKMRLRTNGVRPYGGEAVWILTFKTLVTMIFLPHYSVSFPINGILPITKKAVKANGLPWGRLSLGQISGKNKRERWCE